MTAAPSRPELDPLPPPVLNLQLRDRAKELFFFLALVKALSDQSMD